VLGYAAPYRIRALVLDPERPAKGLDALTEHVFLDPRLREVDGTKPPVFEMGRQPRRRPGVLFPDGKIESVAGQGGPGGRYMVRGTPIVTALPRFVITGSGALTVHKDKLPIIVQCPKVAAHRSEIREELLGEVDRE
jgi:hypothetical protein